MIDPSIHYTLVAGNGHVVEVRSFEIITFHIIFHYIPYHQEEVEKDNNNG